MNRGYVEQIGRPEEIYANPSTRFCADFMGVRNMFAAEIVDVADGSLRARAGGLDILAEHDGRYRTFAGKTVELAIRPEAIRMKPSSENPATSNSIVGTVSSRIFQGAFAAFEVEVDIGGPATLSVRASSFADRAIFVPDVSEQVLLEWNAGDLIVMRNSLH
jgi:ABC-type Fe3+/spermidine/putrescine transport system ATPase subunit